MSAHLSGIQLTAEEQIEIFGTTAFSEGYAVEAGERWGDTDVWKQSRARVSSFTKQDWIDIKTENDALLEALAQAKRAGVEPGSADADELAARHRASIERYYDCGDEMHRSSVEMYLADERFTRCYDDVESGLAHLFHDTRCRKPQYLAGFDVSLGPMSGQPPSGTVTFMLTDLEGSTRMWEEDPQAMRAAMVRHDELLEKAIASHRGFVFSRMGDGMATSFATAGDAIAAAIAFKQALAEENWRTASPLKARIGLHTAEAVIVDDTGYANLPINRCARLMAAAHGGQIVISGSTESLVRDQLPDGAELVDLGEHRLRDLGNPMRVFQLNRAESPDEFPPLRTLDSFPGNLPAQVSSFVGRQADASRVAEALGLSRVVTITGVGGVGKTRLASHVAADLLPQLSRRAWLVELAPVREPDRVVETVAAVFHVNSRSGPTIEDALVDVRRRSACCSSSTIASTYSPQSHSWSRASSAPAPASWCSRPAGGHGGRRRTVDRAATAAIRRAECRHRNPGANRRRQVIRRAGQARQGGLRSHGEQRSCGGGGLPAPRRGATGHRVSGRAGYRPESR